MKTGTLENPQTIIFRIEERIFENSKNQFLPQISNSDNPLMWANLPHFSGAELKFDSYEGAKEQIKNYKITNSIAPFLVKFHEIN